MAGHYEIKNVIVVGAGGYLNPAIIACIQSFGFTVSALVRATSAAPPPSGVQLHRTDYSYASLVAAFKGQDAVVNTITMPAFADQRQIIDAAIEAGVKRFLPGEFGIDTSNPIAVELVPFLKAKPEIIEYLRSVQDKISWTAVLTNPFFEWGLRNGWQSFNIPERTAYLYRPGYHAQRVSVCTRAVIAEAVARSLLPQNASVAVNQYVRIGSFSESQDEILASLEKASLEADQARGVTPRPWTVETVNLDAKAAEAGEKVAQGDLSYLRFMLQKAIFTMGGDWHAQGVTTNEKLGIELQESLDEVVKEVVAEYTE